MAGEMYEDAVYVKETDSDAKTWGMICHVASFAGYVIPFGNIVGPLIAWQIKKDELPGIDVHGKNAINWLISKLIYAVCCFLLTFIIVGVPLLIALMVVGVVFPIIAGVKANSGEAWRYPLSFKFV